jgi:hypothetical protein
MAQYRLYLYENPEQAKLICNRKNGNNGSFWRAGSGVDWEGPEGTSDVPHLKGIWVTQASAFEICQIYTWDS